jgi:hypothetical protein
MEDIISHGDERPPRPRRRRLAIAVALVVLVALAVVAHLPHGHSGSSHPAAARRARGDRLHGGRSHGGSAGLVEVSPIPSWAAATRLPRTGTQPGWFSPASGATQPIRGLPRGSGYVFTRVEGGWAIQPQPPRPAACGDCAGGPVQPAPDVITGCTSCPGLPVPVYYVGDGSPIATIVGVATMIAPAAANGVIWLTSFPADAGLGMSPGVARAFTGFGQVAGPPIRLPLGYAIAAGTDRGVLLAPLPGQGPPATERLWDPVTRRFAGTFRGVIAADGTDVAYRTGCPASCRVQVLNLRSGRDVTLRLIAGIAVASGSFSPDGRFIAVRVSIGTGTSQAAELMVAAVTGGPLFAVPNTWVNSTALTSFGWPAHGDELIATLTFTVKMDMVFWDAQAFAQAITELTPAQDPTTLVVSGKGGGPV